MSATGEEVPTLDNIHERHRIIGAHRCSCGWEGDHPTVHIIDALGLVHVGSERAAPQPDPFGLDSRLRWAGAPDIRARLRDAARAVRQNGLTILVNAFTTL